MLATVRSKYLRVLLHMGANMRKKYWILYKSKKEVSTIKRNIFHVKFQYYHKMFLLTFTKKKRKKREKRKRKRKKKKNVWEIAWLGGQKHLLYKPLPSQETLVTDSN